MVKEKLGREIIEREKFNEQLKEVRFETVIFGLGGVILLLFGSFAGNFGLSIFLLGISIFMFMIAIADVIITRQAELGWIVLKRDQKVLEWIKKN